MCFLTIYERWPLPIRCGQSRLNNTTIREVALDSRRLGWDPCKDPPGCKRRNCLEINDRFNRKFFLWSHDCNRDTNEIKIN
ncbi:hypothetical protein BGW36DRAFT_26313 [Talaromyces proteolyticus]|uniref:Uncharacterized protein n=1 Tax=Talaromyces proteolyticus TaxID=1131652 RepID=A0AAD4KNV7_9EURO|nr:uncharacterized protein BGW36DRAFT_26313 [Talaromyces proteolyticus]KAH8692721.1 hypothetical protein BGW36DRAFT_26313 [Talaromyces proteolyticus]